MPSNRRATSLRRARRAALGRVAAACLAALLPWRLAAAAHVVRAWPSNRPVPPLDLVDLAGKPWRLDGLAGQVVVLNFWATWCEPCRDEMPSLQRLRAKLGNRPFDVLTVNYGESREKISKYLGKEKIALPVLLDPDKESAREWGVGGLPMTFLIDAKGRVRYSVFGECDWSEGPSVALVEKLLAEASDARR
jgi:thiol-disulfide isomerase/thioredoxin